MAALMNARDTVPGLAQLTRAPRWLLRQRRLPRWRSDVFDARGIPPAPAPPHKGEGNLGGERGRARSRCSPIPSTRYFEPENLRDAVEVLSGLGYRVVPLAAAEGGRPLCCGRTFLSAGLVEEARAEARRLLAAARPFVERGVPIVGLEPSCLFTLRDELPAMLPGEEADALAGQALLIEELLAREAAAGRIPKSIARAPGKVVLHGHCHQKAFAAMGAVTAALGLVEGLEVETVELELLRHGGRLRLRRRHPRGLPRHGRALPAAGRAPGTCRGDHRGRRLLLPPPDPRRHRPHPVARRAHPAPRHGRGRCNTTPLTIDAIATFGGRVPRGRPRGGQVGSPPIANNHCP